MNTQDKICFVCNSYPCRCDEATRYDDFPMVLAVDPAREGSEKTILCVGTPTDQNREFLRFVDDTRREIFATFTVPKVKP